MKKMTLRTYLENHIVVADGAMATQLYNMGVPVGICYQELCLTKPDLVRYIHESYIAAGACLIETNTFGVNRDALVRYGLEGKVKEINRAAVQIAREAAADKAYVVGSISSILAGRIQRQSLVQYKNQFEEQAAALLDGGVDGIMLETFLDLDELVMAVELIRPMTEIPIFAQLATIDVGRTRDGYSLSEAFEALIQAGADILGLNCRLGPAEMLRSFEQCSVSPGAILSCFPNAGRLGLDNGEYAYKSSPEYFAASSKRLVEQGVRVIGGCCGTTPEHIKAISLALRGLQPVPRVNPIALPERNRENIEITLRTEPSEQQTIVESVKKRHTVIVEFDPPKDLDTFRFFQGCQALSKAGVDMITLADNSMANVSISNLALGALLKERYNIEPLLHIACRDRNLIGQQSHLMGLYTLGINQILIVTGDPSRFGDLPQASSVFDVSSIDLIRLTKQLNEGISFSGRPLKEKTKFVVGAAFNPYVRNLDAALRRLERKIEAGADFIMTQPVYDTATMIQIFEGTKNLQVPVFIGIMPLTSERNAEYLHNEVPGITLTAEALKRMRGLKGEKARAEGIQMSKELISVAVEYFNGIYLITPFSYFDMSIQLTNYVKNLKHNANIVKKD